jgi:pilus assembly protein CpaB
MFVFALFISAGAAWVANNWLQTQIAPEESRAEGKPTVVAALRIPFGQKIDGAHLKIVRLPEASVPAGAYVDPDEVIGKIANQAIFPGEIVISERIVERPQGSTLAALIAPKKRAVAVRVNDVIGVAGFLLPGNRVDVLATSMQLDRTVVRTILQDIKVLAVDQTASPEKDQPIIVRAVTLELDPAESEILVKATQVGSVQLTLRNPLDNKEIVRAEEEPQEAAASELPPEMLEKRLVTLRDSDVIRLFGLQRPGLLPGTQVDVIATTWEEGVARENMILEDVKVVAVFHARDGLEVIRAVALEVPAYQSQALSNRPDKGSVQLGLRKTLSSGRIAEREKTQGPALKEAVIQEPTRNLTGGMAMNQIGTPF